MRRKRLSLAILGAFALAISVKAAVIGVNFAQSDYWVGNLNPGKSAGFYVEANWNNTTNGASGIVSNLADSTGTPTEADVTWNCGGTYYNYYPADWYAFKGHGDAQLARDYLNDTDTGGGIGVSFTVTDVPYATYTAVIYFSTDVDGGTYQPAVINGVTNSTTGEKSRYLPVNNWQDYNTIIVSNLTGSTFTVAVLAKDGANRGSVAGFQIAESSEGAPPPPAPAPPVWSKPENWTYAAESTEPFTGKTLEGLAYDDEPFIYTKDDGPDWLEVATNGVLTGTPAISDEGTNTFTIAADDGNTTPNTAIVKIIVSEKDWTIAWNFAENWSGAMIQGDGIVDGTSKWTDSVDTASPGGTKVNNSTDPWAITTPINASMVSVAWTSAGTYQAGNNGNAEQRLYRRYLDDSGTGPTVTISGLSDWMIAQGATGYKVDLYQCSDSTANTFAEVNIYNGATTGDPLLETLPPMLAAGDGAYPTDTGGTGSRLKQSLVGTFAADIITFHTDRDLGGGQRGSFSGFKITPDFGVVPGNPATLAIAGPVNGGTGMEISWISQAGFNYIVKTNSDLIFGDWQVFMSGVPGDGGTVAVTNTIGPDQTFYQVITE